MNDSEIIKALECCADEMGCTKGCPCLDEKKGCKISNEGLSNYALDLIKRQQAEIERLEKSRDRWKQIATDFDRFSREAEREAEMVGDV